MALKQVLLECTTTKRFPNLQRASIVQCANYHKAGRTVRSQFSKFQLSSNFVRSCLHSRSDISPTLLSMAYNNKEREIIETLHEYCENNKRITLSTLQFIMGVLCCAQSKEGYVLISTLTEQQYPELFKFLDNCRVYQPILWNATTADRNITHYEQLYSRVLLKDAISNSFRASLICSYLYNEVKTEFLDIYYFVHDILHFFKDPRPLTAFWEVLFTSHKFEDQDQAKFLLKSNRNAMCLGLTGNILSLIFTLAYMKDTASLRRLLEELRSNDFLLSRSSKLAWVHRQLNSMLIDMQYDEGQVEESILLMASNCFQRRSAIDKLSHLKLHQNGINLREDTPKKYFLRHLTLEEAGFLPLTPPSARKQR